MEDNRRKLAEYILQWLETRNGGELAKALDGQTVAGRRTMLDELTMILNYGGRPPNWVA